MTARYPKLIVDCRTSKEPVVAAVRKSLCRAGISKFEQRLFVDEVMKAESAEDMIAVCREWVTLLK